MAQNSNVSSTCSYIQRVMKDWLTRERANTKGMDAGEYLTSLMYNVSISGSSRKTRDTLVKRLDPKSSELPLAVRLNDRYLFIRTTVDPDAFEKIREGFIKGTSELLHMKEKEVRKLVNQCPVIVLIPFIQESAKV